MRGSTSILVVLMCGSCGLPDYGDRPYRCGPGGACPEGYGCQASVCVRNGLEGDAGGTAGVGGMSGAGGAGGGTGGAPDAAVDAAAIDAAPPPRPDAAPPPMPDA